MNSEIDNQLKFIIDLFNRNLNKIENINPILHEIIEIIKYDFPQLGSVVKEKINLTIIDRRNHSASISAGSIYYSISTLACGINQAAERYKSAGGYLKHLDYLLKHESLDRRVFNLLVHITYGSNLEFEGEMWTNIAIIPLSKESGVTVTYLPTDLLSSSEKKNLGLS